MQTLAAKTTLTMILLVASTMLAKGDVVLSLVPNTNNVNVGDRITVSVVLTQDGLDSNGAAVAPDLSRPLTTGFELTGFGVELSISGSAFSITDSTLASGFLDFTGIFSGDTFVKGNTFGAGLTSPATIGTFELTAVGGGTSTLLVTDPTGQNDFGFAGISEGLDTGIFTSFTSPVGGLTAVPEPSAFLFLSLSACVYVGRAWMSRVASVVNCIE